MSWADFSLCCVSVRSVFPGATRLDLSRLVNDKAAVTWRLSGRSNLFSLDWSHRLHIVLALKLWIIWTFRCLFYFDIYSYCSRKKKTRKWLQTAAREEVWLLRNSNFFFFVFHFLSEPNRRPPAERLMWCCVSPEMNRCTWIFERHRCV